MIPTSRPRPPARALLRSGPAVDAPIRHPLIRPALLGLALAACLAVAPAARAQPYPPIPELRAEVVPAPPPGAFLWEPGHWHWRGNQYVWIGGHYIARRPEYVHYVPGHWGFWHGRYRWEPAHWGP